MVLQANFQTGETLNYNGKQATVCDTGFGTSTITIEVDGKCISVDKNDLFGMNNDLQNTSILDSQIESCDEQIAKNKSIIENSKQLWNNAKEEIKSLRNQMQMILNSFGVSLVTQLDDANKAQYNALRSQRVNQRLVQIRATSDIMTAAHSTASAASYKQDLTNTKAFGLA